MISPASAKPSPFSLPALRLMVPRDICPRITAGMPARIERNVIPNTPRMRLATALPSVGAFGSVGDEDGTIGGGGNAPVDWLVATNVWPQLLQNLLVSGFCCPHVVQYMRCKIEQSSVKVNEENPHG